MVAVLLERYGQALLIVAAAFIAGLALDLVVAEALGAIAARRAWRAGSALSRALRWLPTLFAVLIGVRIGIGHIGLPGALLSGTATALEVVAVLGATWGAARLSGSLVRLWTSREETPLPAGSIFVNLVRAAVASVGVVIALDVAGVSIGPLIAALGVGGIAIGLALQPTLENLFSGIQVLVSKQVRPGDFVRLEGGQEGWVHDVTWRNTTIKTVSNDLVIVPNATMGKSLVTNFTSMDEQHSVVLPVPVAYGSDLDRVERVARDVARDVTRTTEGAVPDFEPVVRFRDFGESGIGMVVVVRAVSYADRLGVQHELVKRIHARFAEEGIEIPLPHRVVHLESTPEEG